MTSRQANMFIYLVIIGSVQISLDHNPYVLKQWAKLAQQWLVCVPLRIHLEPINKELMLLVTI